MESITTATTAKRSGCRRGRWSGRRGSSWSGTQTRCSWDDTANKNVRNFSISRSLLSNPFCKRDIWAYGGLSVRNIFLVYIPPGNPEAMVHYEETIRQKVPSDRIYRYIDSVLRSRLVKIFSGRP